MRPTIVLAGCALALLLPVASAHAYIDPGAGSLLVQGLLAGLAGAAAVLSLFWGRVRGLWDRLRTNRSRAEVPPEQQVGPRV
jgi:hypothetical protein